MLNELNLTPELLEKAKSATSAEALLALAQENGITLTTEEATTYYSQLHPKEGALSDDELDNVSGGGICGDPTPKELAIEYVTAKYCNKDPRCPAYQTERIIDKDRYRMIPVSRRKICPGCECKPEMDAYCRNMGWPTLEVYSGVF